MANTYALDLELSNGQYLWCTDNATVSLTGDITIEGWIKLEQLPSTAGATFTLVNKGDTSLDKRSYSFLISSISNKLIFSFSSNGTDYGSTFTCDTAFVAGDVGVQHHVAVTCDVSVPSAIFYIDSVAKTDTETATGHTSIQDNNSRFGVGAQFENTVGVGFFDGVIDDVRLWSDIRTASEISVNYQRELAGNEGNLVCYWKLNNAYTDSGPNGITLTPAGLVTFTTSVPFADTTTTSTSTSTTSTSSSTTTTSTSNSTTTTSTSSSTTSTSTTTTSTSTTTTSTSTTTTSTSTTTTSTTTTVDLRFIVEDLN